MQALAAPLARWRGWRPVEGGSATSLAVVGVVGALLGAGALAISGLPSPWPPLLVVAALVPFVALIVGQVRRLLLAVVLIDIPFQVDTHLGYRYEAAELGALGGWNVSLTTLALAGLYAIWLAELLARIPGRRRPALGASLPPAAYLGFVGLSTLVAADATLASFELALLAQMLLLYLYLVSSVRTRGDVVFVVTLLLVGLAAEGLLMIGLRALGQSVSIAGFLGRVDVTATARGQSYRLGGTLGSANAAATYLSLLLAPALGVLLTPLGRWRKGLAVAALALGGVALIITLSRGGWVAFALSIALFGLLAHRRGWLPPIVPVGFALIVVAAGLLFQDAIASRLLDDDHGSAESRVPLMRLALRVIEDHALLGIGANNFATTMLEYATPDFSDYGEWLYVVHNRYLLVWAETGLGGLAAFLWFLLATVRAGWRGWQRHDRLLSPLALGLTAAIVGHLVHLSVDLFSGRAQAQTLWTCAALVVAIGRVAAPGPAVEGR